MTGWADAIITVMTLHPWSPWHPSAYVSSHASHSIPTLQLQIHSMFRINYYIIRLFNMNEKWASKMEGTPRSGWGWGRIMCGHTHNTKNTCIQIQSLKLTVHHQVAPMKWNTNSQHLRFWVGNNSVIQDVGWCNWRHWGTWAVAPDALPAVSTSRPSRGEALVWSVIKEGLLRSNLNWCNVKLLVDDIHKALELFASLCSRVFQLHVLNLEWLHISLQFLSTLSFLQHKRKIALSSSAVITSSPCCKYVHNLVLKKGVS